VVGAVGRHGARWGVGGLQTPIHPSTWQADDGDASLIACDAIGSWRLLCTVLSCSPSAATSSSPPAARGNSPCPRPACPERKKERKKERLSKKERPEEGKPTKTENNKTKEIHARPPASAPSALLSILIRLRWYFVVLRKSTTALVHRSSASRSRTVKRSLPLPVAFRASAHSVFCCDFRLLQCLSRCSRVCVLYWHHPHATVSEFFVHSRCCPVRQCPVLSWWNRSASLFGPCATVACCLILSGCRRPTAGRS